MPSAYLDLAALRLGSVVPRLEKGRPSLAEHLAAACASMTPRNTSPTWYARVCNSHYNSGFNRYRHPCCSMPPNTDAALLPCAGGEPQDRQAGCGQGQRAPGQQQRQLLEAHTATTAAGHSSSPEGIINAAGFQGASICAGTMQHSAAGFNR